MFEFPLVQHRTHRSGQVQGIRRKNGTHKLKGRLTQRQQKMYSVAATISGFTDEIVFEGNGGRESRGNIPECRGLDKRLFRDFYSTHNTIRRQTHSTKPGLQGAEGVHCSAAFYRTYNLQNGRGILPTQSAGH